MDWLKLTMSAGGKGPIPLLILAAVVFLLVGTGTSQVAAAADVDAGGTPYMLNALGIAVLGFVMFIIYRGRR